MSGFTDRFGGSQLQPSDVAYRAVTLDIDQQTYWPPYANSTNVLARLMEVTSSVADLKIGLPSALESTPGADVTFHNAGIYAFALTDVEGNGIYNVLPGQFVYVYLQDNTTPEGVWGVILMGVGVGTLDLLNAAGNGLVVAGSRLAVSPIASEVAGNTAIALTDRAKAFIWAGGSGVFTLPLSSTVGQFFFEVRNQGTGTLTLQCQGGETIDESTSIILQVGESCLVHAGDASWFTVGRGKSAQFAFTQLQKTVTGGVVVLTLVEAANVVQTYTGTLTSNVDIVLPAVVQVYYISNQTTGAFNFRLKNPGAGQTVSLPSGQNAVIFSDGTNVINAATTVAGIGSLLFGPGSATVPSVAIGASNTGLYSANTGETSVTSGGVKTAAIDAAGVRAVGASASIGAVAPTGNATVVADRPAGSVGVMQFNTATSVRFDLGVNAVAEVGANAGSNMDLNRYSDAGALLGTALSVNRATGLVTINDLLTASLRDTAAIGRVEIFAQGTTTAPNCLFMDGSLVSRTTYAALWAYASANAISEAAWAANNQGRFSIGDGSTTFRLPDVRGTVIRALDSGRGLDPARGWGTYQADQNLSHVHGVSDPSHTHSVSDPSHGHTGATDVQGTHQHGSSQLANAVGLTNAGTQFNFAQNVSGAVAAEGAHAHNVTAYGAFTGIGIFAAVTGISITANGGTEARVKNYAYPMFIRYQ